MYIYNSQIAGNLLQGLIGGLGDEREEAGQSSAAPFSQQDLDWKYWFDILKILPNVLFMWSTLLIIIAPSNFPVDNICTRQIFLVSFEVFYLFSESREVSNTLNT